MQSTTRKRTDAVRRALLELPDEQLHALVIGPILAWLLDELEPDEDLMRSLGASVRSAATSTSYTTVDELLEAEPDAEEWQYEPPAPAALRERIRRMQPRTFYHAVQPLLIESLDTDTLTAAWGEPPGGDGDGYDFMRALAGYLRFLGRLVAPVDAPSADETADQPAAPKLISQQQWEALGDALRVELGLPAPEIAPIEVDHEAWLTYEFGSYRDLEWWEIHAIEQQRDREQHLPAVLDPSVCVCDGTLRLVSAWLHAHQADGALNLAAMREQAGASCDCGLVLRAAAWPELRRVADDVLDWPFGTKKKKKKKQRAKR